MSEFIFKRYDGKNRKVSGYQFEAPKANSKRYKAERYNESSLPKKVDLRQYMTAIENQEQIGSCAANAVAGAYEFLIKRHQNNDHYDVSRLFIYYNARRARGNENEDSGSVINVAINSLKEIGACSEQTWPYETNEVFTVPPDEAYNEASQFLIDDTELIPVDLHSWKHALAEGYPIVFGIRLYPSFDKQKSPGIVPAPNSAESTRDSHGAHAMLCVGYSDIDKMFIVRNSWGDNWGDNGYCYMPYSYIINEDFNLGDSWIIRKATPVPDSEELWCDDDESLLITVQFGLSQMSDEAWSDMIEDMGHFSIDARLTLLLLTACGADGDISQEEIDGIVVYLEDLLKMLGLKYDAAELITNVLEFVGDSDLTEESAILFGKHLSNNILASILADIARIASADEAADEEIEFVHLLVQCWQLDSENEDEYVEDCSNDKIYVDKNLRKYAKISEYDEEEDEIDNEREEEDEYIEDESGDEGGNNEEYEDEEESEDEVADDEYEDDEESEGEADDNEYEDDEENEDEADDNEYEDDEESEDEADDNEYEDDEESEDEVNDDEYEDDEESEEEVNDDEYEDDEESEDETDDNEYEDDEENEDEVNDDEYEDDEESEDETDDNEYEDDEESEDDEEDDE